ncbi:MAG: alkaline phosphatase D family protein [Saprospiraceae bacterium]|nr:alkaline phosphatase D family protein [Saprospiraceae bacterium]HMW37916.1 alkaline phosphatase D family protein [Saprospiraceae bacterium]HMX87340.1 alkaline phosphatase D family protein [Saprospiraceae bacterium]HMZ39167.1 alkaline phosphatase D family protein [Saprospiraceae bacterium]HNA63828.1 alkaline phosphatase D family protein [Saprospiraceae bacterium]
MRQLLHLSLFVILLGHASYAQIKSGPMLGYVELRTAKVWCEVIPGTHIGLDYWAVQEPEKIHQAFRKVNSFMNFETVQFDLVDLQPGTRYEYRLTGYEGKRKIDSKLPRYHGFLTTQELWRWRRPAPDFSLITGSCAYFNEPVYDRPGNPYGSDSIIFETMSKEKANLMVWLGDNWYTREADYGSEWGLWYRASRDRSLECLRELNKNMSNVAIWDDHDFGPNNEGAAYIFKEESRRVFQSYWANPTYGMDNKGIYTKVSYNDVDLFLMDGRSWRSSDDLPDQINGQPNMAKRMFGQEQMDWLKNALLNSTAAFKIIVSGSQMLNPLSPLDCFTHFPAEKKELMDFLQTSKVNGVLFLSGDRHLSEINKIERDSLYTLYDITVSSLTAGVSKMTKEEKVNPNRVNNFFLEEHNFGRFTFTGDKKNRKLNIDFIDKNGNTRHSFEISASALKNK